MPQVTGRQLRRAREAAGLTQKEAARACEVDERTYQRWESGETARVRGVYVQQVTAAAKRRARRAVLSR